MAIVRNLATVKTTADITSSATSIPVNRVDVFGTSQTTLDNPFYVTIMPASGDEPANSTNSEIVLVTGISGSNLTVTRGQRSTTAKAFNSGAIVTMAIYAEDAVLLGDGGTAVGTPAPWINTSDIKNGAITTDKIADGAVKSSKIDFTTFNSNGLPTADGSVSRQNVGTVYYKKILPNIFLIWGNIKPIYDDNSIKLPFSSAMSDYSQIFTLYGAGMNSTKGFIAPGASSIGFTKQTTGNTYALWAIAALNG